MMLSLKQIITLLLITITLRASAQIKHDWKITLKVVDEAGLPLAGITTHTYFLLTNEIVGLTDSNGIFIASHHDGSENLAFAVDSQGYYPVRLPYHLGRNFTPVKWDHEQTIILKRIGQPIPMYAKVENAKITVEDQPIGFDLMLGDWTAPYGKGSNVDLLFSVHRQIVNEKEYTAELKLTFPNAGDGIAVVPMGPDTVVR
jgi:hypothetical protein